MMWSLPKGDTSRPARPPSRPLVREVAEETGIQGSVVAPLGKIDYWFVSEGRRIHKTVHHYLSAAPAANSPTPTMKWPRSRGSHWSNCRSVSRILTSADWPEWPRVSSPNSPPTPAVAQSEAQNSRTEPNDYEKAAAARNQRRKDRRRRRVRAGAVDVVGGRPRPVVRAPSGYAGRWGSPRP